MQNLCYVSTALRPVREDNSKVIRICVGREINNAIYAKNLYHPKNIKVIRPGVRIGKD